MQLIFIRHAESVYNAYKKVWWCGDPGVIDAPLSPKGERQALRTAASIADKDVEVVFASPLTRALQTAALLFPGKRIVALPLLRERGHTACDQGRVRAELMAEFPHADLSHVPEDQ